MSVRSPHCRDLVKLRPVEEREALARERLAAPLLGEHSEVDVAGFDEAVAVDGLPRHAAPALPRAQPAGTSPDALTLAAGLQLCSVATLAAEQTTWRCESLPPTSGGSTG